MEHIDSWDSNSCMEVSPDSKVASILPRLGHWVPCQDFGEVVVVTIGIIDIDTAADVDNIVDQGCSQGLPW